MSKMLNFLLVLLLLGNIKSILTGINEEEDEKQAIDIKFGYKVEYDKNRNYFRFIYEGSNETKIFFDIDYHQADLNLIYPSGEKAYLKIEDVGDLTENGTYFIEVICKSYACELGGYFNSFILGDIMDTIDLSKNVYFSDKQISIRDSYYYGDLEYKVNNLNEDKYVYFEMEIYNDIYYNEEYYPYYPDDPHLAPYGEYTIFEVVNIHNSSESKRNVKIYEFKKGNEYIIKIHSLISKYDYYREKRDFYYQKYFFFRISEQNFKKITGEETLISSEGPMICLINPNNLKKFL